MDEATQEQVRMPLHGDQLLPRLEHDRSLVFRAWAMLWEQASPMLGKRVDLLASLELYKPNLVRNYPTHSQLTLADKCRISIILKDPKLKDISWMA